MIKPNALVIEDHKNMASAFAEALELAGYKAQTTDNSISAGMMLAATKFDLVLLDLHLLYGEGEQILQKIRSVPGLSETQVIIVTADARRAKELQDAADLVLLKPIGFMQLRDIAKRMLPQ
jgi:DNA-binding response OmpR family regulator